MDVLGYVLAGGRSRRLGLDKAEIVIDGRTALQRQLETVSDSGCTRVIVIGGGDRRGPGVSEVVEDRHGHRGPLDGLLTALAHAEDAGAPLAMVVAVDLWNLTADALRNVLAVHTSAAVGNDTDVAYLRSEVDEQPLAAVWRVRTSRAVLEPAFDGGERSLMRAWLGLRRTPVTVAAEVLVNVNTMEDLEGWKATRPSMRGGVAPGDPR